MAGEHKFGVIKTDKKSIVRLQSLNYHFPPPHIKDKKLNNPITALNRPIAFQEVETHRLQDNRHMKVVRLPAFTPRNHLWYSFLLEAESTPGP
jgi:hypothetical protein